MGYNIHAIKLLETRRKVGRDIFNDHPGSNDVQISSCSNVCLQVFAGNFHVRMQNRNKNRYLDEVEVL